MSEEKRKILQTWEQVLMTLNRVRWRAEGGVGAIKRLY
jgi:hypothetical protein